MIICYHHPSGVCTVPDATGSCRKHSGGRFPLNRLFHSGWCNNNSFTLLAFITWRHMRSQAPLIRRIITTSCVQSLCHAQRAFCVHGWGICGSRSRAIYLLSDVLTEARRNMNIITSTFVNKERDSLWTASRDFPLASSNSEKSQWDLCLYLKVKHFPLNFQGIFAPNYNCCNWIFYFYFLFNSSFRCLLTKPCRTKLDVYNCTCGLGIKAPDHGPRGSQRRATALKGGVQHLRIMFTGEGRMDHGADRLGQQSGLRAAGWSGSGIWPGCKFPILTRLELVIYQTG